jgi:membrane protein insertase Oxa1/YidC/SpoIIIJ
MVAGQLVGFGISVVMLVIGVILCLYSVYDRKVNAEEQAKKIAEEVAKIQSKKEGITASPIPLADLNDIIKAINEIKNPFMQVGVFLTVFGIIVMIISIFIPF